MAVDPPPGDQVSGASRQRGRHSRRSTVGVLGCVALGSVMIGVAGQQSAQASDLSTAPARSASVTPTAAATSPVTDPSVSPPPVTPPTTPPDDLHHPSDLRRLSAPR